jgi:hypothetical protein
MRPLMATFLSPTVGQPPRGSYDQRLAITLDSDGSPLVETDRPKTVTKVVAEPADDNRTWASVVTRSAAPLEPADDNPVWALKTLTRVVNEPTDDDRVWAEALETGLPLADDSAVGLVSF